MIRPFWSDDVKIKGLKSAWTQLVGESVTFVAASLSDCPQVEFRSWGSFFNTGLSSSRTYHQAEHTIAYNIYR